MATVRFGGLRFRKLYNTVASVGVRNYHADSLEIGYPIPGKEPTWTTADKALECLKSDMFLFAHGAAATPFVLLQAMTKKAKKENLKEITLCHLHLEMHAAEAPWVGKEMNGAFR